MLRNDTDIDSLHARQVGKLPGRYGLVITALQEGRIHGEIALEPWMMAPNGFLHAASVVMLADTCCGYATFAHLPDGARGFTTIEMKSNFLGTAMQGMLRAEGVAEHLGRNTQVWSATVFGDGGKKTALFRCTQMVLW